MKNITTNVARWMLALSIVAVATATRAEDDEPQPIEVAVIQREDPVDFEKEILPILKKSCLACHNEAARNPAVDSQRWRVGRDGYAGQRRREPAVASRRAT